MRYLQSNNNHNTNHKQHHESHDGPAAGEGNIISLSAVEIGIKMTCNLQQQLCKLFKLALKFWRTLTMRQTSNTKMHLQNDTDTTGGAMNVYLPNTNCALLISGNGACDVSYDPGSLLQGEMDLVQIICHSLQLLGLVIQLLSCLGTNLYCLSHKLL